MALMHIVIVTAIAVGIIADAILGYCLWADNKAMKEFDLI